MLKNAGILLIILSGAGIGYSKSRELTLRERNLRQFLQMTVYLKGAIRCGCSSLPDAFSETAEKLPGIYGEFLRETACCLRDARGQTLGEIYRQCWEEKFSDLMFSAEERDLLLSFGGKLGYLDREMQLRQMELCEEEIQGLLNKLRKEMPDKKKIYQSLGVLGGVLLAVLLW